MSLEVDVMAQPTKSGVEITPSAMNVLAQHGVTQEALKSTVDHYRSEGWSDADISAGLWKKIKSIDPHLLTPEEIEVKTRETRYPSLVKQMAEYGMAPGDYGDEATYTERFNKDSQRFREMLDGRIEANQKGIESKEKWMARIAGFGSASTLGMSNLMMAGADALTGSDLMDEVKEVKEKHPDSYLTGSVAGYLNPLGGSAALMKGVTVGGKVVGVAPMAKAASGKVLEVTKNKAAAFGTKLLTNALGTQALFAAEETSRQLAETGEFFREGQALDEMEGVGLNMAIDFAFSGAGAAGRAVKKMAGNWLSKTQKAINAMGGEANVIKGQAARDAVLQAGGSAEEGASAFWASIMEGLPPEKQGPIRAMMVNNPEFVRFAQQQMAGAGAVVADTVHALTKPEYAKTSHSILRSLWGNARNNLGSNEIDFTKKGLDRLLGLDNGQKVLEMRKLGLARAEQKVMSNPSLARDVRMTFDELRDNLVTNGSRDLERATNMVEQGTLKSFEGSVEQAEALASAQKKIAAAQQAYMEAGKQFGRAEADDILMYEMRNGARKHFKNVMSAGTDSIQDINDIKEFFKAVDEGAVKSGQAEAFGAFNEGVNSRILDGLDETLYKANQAQRFGKKLGDMHDFGRKYTPERFNELESVLNNGVSAEEKATKLAAFKMGMLDRVTEAAVMGDAKAFEQARQLMTAGKLKQYFTPEEVNAYMDIIRPKMEAARNIENIVRASQSSLMPKDSIAAPAVRATLGTMFYNAANVVMNSIVTILSRVSPYGPKTAAKIQELTQNKDWKTFNALNRSITDPVERRFFNQMVVTATQDAAQETMIGR